MSIAETDGTVRARAVDAVTAAKRGLTLALLGYGASIGLSVLAWLSITLIPLGIGALTTPPVMRWVRAYADHRRRLAKEWAGIAIPTAYAPPPAALRTGGEGMVDRTMALVRDPATWRDLRWLSVDVVAGSAVAVLAPGLLAEGVFGVLLLTGLWQPIVAASDGWWYGFVPVTGWATAAAAALLGCGWLALALRYNPALIRTHFRIVNAQLAPSAEQLLARRVEKLTETRRDAVDTSAAELRRIERDLHDGAQARLVAMGMDLSTIEMLLDTDPAKARALLAQARRNSVDALGELRDLVRGIHPPVLAERGLGDAVRALALRLPIATEVTVELPGRADAPVESAAYFAVSEVLTNAVKHADAELIRVDLHHADGSLRIAVTDDGRGGARVGAGSGLAGVERRLGTFDGVLAVSSPAGGPTMVTMEIPCVLS
ncbi:sensor histidine kinase [Streptomyces mangrovisoli]|uniref:histidine kinase n=1 Tax=Streptomyces mangrovisoli TaxID=1428628 RepID=A0A1J4P0Y4_9ACTN|nr:histidine kinase [Streptomyces mangrovisoli]OIJ67141.1 sensor histidine kinase [Streptomyces mangrovisoli]